MSTRNTVVRVASDGLKIAKMTSLATLFWFVGAMFSTKAPVADWTTFGFHGNEQTTG